jgi:hypothetical protein
MTHILQEAHIELNDLKKTLDMKKEILHYIEYICIRLGRYKL